MITRLRINGFKNLVDVDVRFGPFTCIAGVNAIGKSNLFDAIHFLNMLASEEIMEAAKKIRSEGQRASDIKDIFHKVGEHHTDLMSFEVDLILPKSAVDDSGAMAEASITTVRYNLILRLRRENSVNIIEIEKEELLPISQQNAKRDIFFPASPKWKKEVVKGRRSSNAKFISTETEGKRLVRIHQDQEKGKPYDRDPVRMGRTALSTVSAEFPTACVVKEELRSWTFLQLEPSSLRKSDEIHLIRNAKIQADGAHMPATLYRLKSEEPQRDILQEVTNRLSQLIDDNMELKIEKDEKRDLLTLVLSNQNDTEISARSLSDGTLRFLALTILEVDYSSNGVICLEEPENGIHPKKIPAMIKLLEDIACDTNFEPDIEQGNPLRQVIINTHSPLVVQNVPEDSLLVAEGLEHHHPHWNQKYIKVRFSPLPNTWRQSDKSMNTKTVSLGKLLAYLGGTETEKSIENTTLPKTNGQKGKSKKVIERDDIQKQLALF